ncbi:TonB-dependent receptor [Gaoshiqia sp. Z1-71]|uniref:TonB-dependent receptor n=1 Tax=Gaoshiqia hydrogeniformans TaxID=3290090 RepID=UPI003BF7D32E
MKLTVFLFLISILAATASTYSQQSKFDLNYKNVAIKEVLNEIKARSDFQFFYSNDDFDINRKVDVQVKDASVEEVLNQLLESMDVTYKIVDKSVIISRNDMKWSFDRMNQVNSIAGKVTDSAGMPLPGVTVVIKGTTTGTITGGDGHYSLANVAADAVLVFSFVGMKNKELSVSGKSTLHVVMDEETIGIGEVIAVGYGVQKKENLTGAVSVVKMEQILGSRPVTNVGAALQGTIPGLVVTGDAIPGKGKTFNIRGTTSINGGEPLILVDNVPAQIDLINPEDIESVSVLKDASSAAVYGARGAFGVILITTKKAKKNAAPQLNYNNNFGFIKSINRPVQASVLDILETQLAWDNDGKYYADGQILSDWIEYVKEYNNNPSAFPANGIYMPEGTQTYYYLKDNDPQGAILDNFGFQQTHNVSASGGSEKTTYRISLGYTDNQGTLITNKDSYDRVSISSFVSTDITSWFTQSLDIRYANSNRSYVESDASIYRLQLPRFYPIGNIVRSNDLEGPAYPTNAPSNYLLLKDPVKYKEENPRIFSRTSIRPFKGFEAIFEYTFDKNNSDRKFYNSPFEMTNDQMGLLWSDNPSSGRYRNDKSLTDYNAINTYGTYELSLNGNHNFKAMAGYSQESRYYESMWARRDEMINPDMPSLSSATGEMQVNDEYKEYAIRSGFFRLNYDFAGRYLFEANGRYDGSSKFPSKSRFGFFPSFSLGWQMAQEKWMEWSRSYIDELKIRGSWGQIGNQAISEYAYTPAMGTYQAQWIQAGKRPMTLNAPGLVRNDFSWEVVQTLNFGVDFRLLNDRLAGTFDWYQRDTKDMLMPGAEFPSIVGTSAPEQNAADLSTKGWEFAISWRDKIGNWGYNVGFNIYDSKSVITKYDNAAGLFYERNSAQDAKRYREGMVLGEIWGYVTDRYYTIDDFQDGWQSGSWVLKEGVTTIKGNNTIRPGDIMFKNLVDDPDNGSVNQIDNGRDNIYDPGDRTIIGNQTPRFQFGTNMGVSWKNIDLSVFLQGTGKRDAWLGGDLVFPLANGGYGTMYSHQLDYWKPIDPANGNWNPVNPNAEFPRLYDENKNAASNRRIQTKYLSNASYIRLKNITLSYKLPGYLVKKVNMAGVKVFFSGENLHTWDKLPEGFDPERLNWGYPFYRTCSFGINVTL